MYYEFYLDIYFLENLIINGLVLHMAGLAMKERRSPVRIAAAAALGACGACLIVLLPVHKNAALSTLLSLLLIPLMAAAQGGRKKMARAVPGILCAALFLGAVWRILCGNFGMPFYLAVPAGYGFARFLWSLWRRLRGRTQYLYDVTLQRGEKYVRLRGLLDSGNRLVQPVTAKPVHIVDYERIKELLDEREQRELLGLLNMEADGGASGKFTYIPYHAIGNSEGVLPALTLDGITVKHGENVWSTKGALAAVSREAVSSGGEYQMILHPRILE